MDILSGKTPITRKLLHELSSSENEDIAELATQIASGTFEGRRQSAASRNESAASLNFSDGKNPWEATFGKITDDFHKELRKLTSADGTAVLPALRLYIGMLEDLYTNIEGQGGR